MADYLGTRAASSSVYFKFTTHAATGAPVAPLSAFEAADLVLYKDGSATQRTSANGITMTSPFDSTTGLHHVTIDLSDDTDAGFYAAGSFYSVVLVPDETVDGLAVTKVLVYFDIGVPVANVTQWLGTAAATPTVAGVPEVDITHLAGTTAGVANLKNAFDDTAGPVPWSGIVDQGTAQSASATGVVLRAAAAFADSTLVGCTIQVLGSDQGYWQERVITANLLSGDAVTVSTWTVTPSGTITYKIWGSAPGEGVAQTGDSYAIVNSGTYGNAALKTLIDTIDNFLDTEIAALVTYTDTEVAAILALLDDARGEPGQGAPGVSVDLATKIDYLYKAWRNLSTQTSTEYALYADDGVTKDQEAACSDNGTTFSRGEIGTGA